MTPARRDAILDHFGVFDQAKLVYTSTRRELHAQTRALTCVITLITEMQSRAISDHLKINFLSRGINPWFEALERWFMTSTFGKI